MMPCYCHGDDPASYCPRHTSLPGESPLAGRAEARGHVHVFSVFGRWCYLCGHTKRWWAFWESWTEAEHDEPF